MERPNIRLRQNGLLAKRRGIRNISCDSGILWVTARGTGDILLRAGESVDTEGCRDLCVQALEDSEFRMESGRATQFAKGDAPAAKGRRSRRGAEVSPSRLPLASNL